MTGVAAASALVGVGTAFDTDYAAGDIIGMADDGDLIQYYTVDAVADATNLTIVGTFRTNITAKACFLMNTNTPYFIQADSVTSDVVGKVRLYNGPTDESFDDTTISKLLVSNQGLSQIDANEGILIESIYVRMPFQYTWADQHLGVTFQYVNEAQDTVSQAAGFGDNGNVHIPVENTEIPINLLLPSPQSLETPVFPGEDLWSLAISLTAASGQRQAYTNSPGNEMANTWISTLEAPDEMDGMFLPVVVGIRIKFGFDLT